MPRTLLCVVVFLVSSMAFGGLIPIGFIDWNVHSPGSAGSFDIVNQTGPNHSIPPDTTWPVVTPVSLGSLSLMVDFNNGTSHTYPSSYFTLAADGLSWNGADIPIGGANPKPIDATLTGSFTPTTIVETDGSVHTINPTFTTTFSDSPTLVDGDLGIIYATDAGGGAVPEPARVSWILMGTFFLGLITFRNRGMFGKFRTVLGRGVQIALFLTVVIAMQSQSWAQVNLNTWTSPSSGVAGVDYVNANGSGFPAGPFTASNVSVTLSLVCGGPAVASTTAASIIHVFGSSYRVHFLIPSTLLTANYFVQVSDSADANPFTSNNCSEISVTHTSSTLSGCAPASSLGINSPVTGPARVQAVVPQACWSCGGTGIKVVELENGGGAPKPVVTLATPSAVNSCAANPATGEFVCVGNDNRVYDGDAVGGTLTGTFLSASNAFTGFSGGSCENCGVAMDALNNHALIAMGHTGGLSGTAIQVFDLNTHTFTPPTQLSNHVTEDIVIDPLTSYYLSANESNNFDIIPYTPATGTPTGEFGHFVSGIGGELDSTAVDCTTHIAGAPSEFTENIVLVDTSQAIFTPGTPGSWSAPNTIFTFSGTSLSAGASGMVIAPGSSHLGIVTGEFGGSSFVVIQLPSTSGPGTPPPTVLDYAFVPCLSGVSAGLDPHTVSAYTSPNDGKAYGVFASGGPPPSSLAVVDLAGILARPRTAGTHTVIGDPGAGSCLVAGDGVFRSVSTF